VALEFDCRSLVEEQCLPWFWSSLNPSFREAVVADSGLFRYGVGNPLELDRELWTDRWEMLCGYLAEFPSLEPDRQVRVARLLNRMCFFRYTRDLIPADVAARAHESESRSALSWLRAMAGYRLWMEDLDDSYSLDEFERLADSAPPGLMRINVLYQMVVQNVKEKADLAATEHWQELHRAAIDAARPDLDEHDYLMAMSRSYRVAAFIPQLRRDRDGVVRDMDLAEQYARQMDRGTEVQRAYARELLYPVGESRIKEALWLKDLDLALQRAVAHRDAHRLDARVWVHCGEVYVRRDEMAEALGCFREAARLAPPGGEVARFMAGQCYEELGELDAALDAYLAALRADPLGISSAEGLLRVSEALGSGVRFWAAEVLNDLERLRVEQDDQPGKGDDAYRHLPPPVPKDAP
jgi:tetratricopeptide (TPR) repeat protein